jgi:hypothetical protein
MVLILSLFGALLNGYGFIRDSSGVYRADNG